MAQKRFAIFSAHLWQGQRRTHQGFYENDLEAGVLFINIEFAGAGTCRAGSEKSE